MELVPLGNGFAKLISGTSVIYFYRAFVIPKTVLCNILDIENPTEADSFTCELADIGK